jgi:hypothetical protein
VEGGEHGGVHVGVEVVGAVEDPEEDDGEAQRCPERTATPTSTCVSSSRTYHGVTPLLLAISLAVKNAIAAAQHLHVSDVQLI